MRSLLGRLICESKGVIVPMSLYYLSATLEPYYLGSSKLNLRLASLLLIAIQLGFKAFTEASSHKFTPRK